MALLSNSYDNMCINVLSTAGLATYWCIVYVLISKHVLVTMCINFSKYMFSSSRTCSLSLSRWVCQKGGIACVCTMTCMLLNSLACNQQHCSPFLLRANCWDGPVTCTGIVSSICACCTPSCTYSCYNYFSRLCSSCSSLSCYFSTCNSFSVLFSSFTIFVLRRHLICSFSKAAFVMSGSALNLQLCFASMLSTTFLLHSSWEGVLNSSVADGVAHCDAISIHLDILVHEQLDVFVLQIHLGTWTSTYRSILLGPIKT